MVGERLARLVGIALGLEPAHAGMDEDHVDRVPCRVVEVAGDATALLGRGQAALALSLALGAQRALLELGDALAPEPGPIAGQPRAAPDGDPEQDLRAEDAAGHNMHAEHRGHYAQGQARALARSVAGERQQVDGDGRPDRRPGRVGDGVEQEAARQRRGDEDGEGRHPPRHERQRRKRRDHHVERAEPVRPVLALAHCEQPDRRGERPEGETGIEQQLVASRCPGR